MAVVQQRPLRGSRISTFYPVKTLPSLASLDSAFQLQEYISLLIRLDVHDVDAIVSLPGKAAEKDREKESEDETSTDITEEKSGEDKDVEKAGKVEVAVDEACWIYEQLRRLAQDLSHPLITMLQQECTRASCPEMKAGEWLYLCVAHGNDGAMESCCAIDYILHTVDSATALLNSPRTFPSRLQIPQTSHRHFSALARRLGRIFAHAYFHHREVFEQAEAESSLYARFLALTSKFDLVPAEFLVIPQRSHTESTGISRNADVPPPRLLAAAVDPVSQQDDKNLSKSHDEEPQSDSAIWDQPMSAVAERVKNDSPPGLGNGSESPRKVGRNRTDTMVFHEASALAERLARTEEEEMIARRMDMETFTPLDWSEGGAVETPLGNVDVAPESASSNVITPIPPSQTTNEFPPSSSESTVSPIKTTKPPRSVESSSPAENPEPASSSQEITETEDQQISDNSSHVAPSTTLSGPESTLEQKPTPADVQPIPSEASPVPNTAELSSENADQEPSPSSSTEQGVEAETQQESKSEHLDTVVVSPEEKTELPSPASDNPDETKPNESNNDEDISEQPTPNNVDDSEKQVPESHQAEVPQSSAEVPPVEGEPEGELKGDSEGSSHDTAPTETTTAS